VGGLGAHSFDTKARTLAILHSFRVGQHPLEVLDEALPGGEGEVGFALEMRGWDGREYVCAPVLEPRPAANDSMEGAWVDGWLWMGGFICYVCSIIHHTTHKPKHRPPPAPAAPPAHGDGAAGQREREGRREAGGAGQHVRATGGVGGHGGRVLVVRVVPSEGDPAVPPGHGADGGGRGALVGWGC
jgi:hypothetical protein